MEPGTARSLNASWRRWSIGLFVAVVVVVAALLRVTRGRGVLGVGLRAVALVLVLAVAAAVVRRLVKARGYGPTLREVVVTLLGVACVLVFLWFVVMYG